MLVVEAFQKWITAGGAKTAYIYKPNATRQEQLAQNINDICRIELTPNSDRQSFVRELVDHIEHPVLSPVLGFDLRSRRSTHDCGAPGAA